MAEPRKTPLYKQHIDLKGDVVNYSGWLLPVQYEGIVAEVNGTRRKAGLFDVSHMGEFLVEGCLLYTSQRSPHTEPAGASRCNQPCPLSGLYVVCKGEFFEVPPCYHSHH